MFNHSACLGLSILGACSYNPSNPTVYFSLGEGISSLAILLLLKQFIGPMEKFRIFVRSGASLFAHSLFILGMLFIVIAAVLPLIPGQAIPLLGYPIFWEILAAIFFVGGISKLYYIMKKPVIFSKNNHKKFMRQVHDFMARNDDAELGQLAIEISYSIGRILDVIENRDEISNSDHKNNAEATLCFLSDKKFCGLIANRDFTTLFTILNHARECLKRNGNLKKSSIMLIRELIKQSITSKNSFLSRAKDSSGIIFAESFKRIFEDYPFILETRLLESWNCREDIKLWKIKNYFFILTTALEGCIKNNTFKSKTNPFLSPFENIVDLTMFTAYKLKRLPENEAQESLAYQVISSISRGFIGIIELLKKYNSDSIVAFDPCSYEYLEDPSIYGVVSYGVFRFFTAVSVCLAHDQLTANLARLLWCDINQYIVSQELQKKLFFHLLHKIRGNLENHHYPMVTRLIINLVGLSEPKINHDEDLENIFANEFRTLLKQKYRNVIDKKPDFAKEMLPDTVRYDVEKNILIQKWPNAETTLALD